ncbi:MAG: chemotaxis protein CheA, partial [Nitrospinota bacterium]
MTEKHKTESLEILDRIEARVALIGEDQKSEGELLQIPEELKQLRENSKHLLSAKVNHLIIKLIEAYRFTSSNNGANQEVVANVTLEIIEIVRTDLTTTLTEHLDVLADISNVLDKIYLPVENPKADVTARLITEPPTKAGVDKKYSIVQAELLELGKIVEQLGDSFKDKKLVSNLMLGFESAAIKVRELEPAFEIIKLADLLAKLYELIIMKGVSDCKLAIEVTKDGISILELALKDGNSDASSLDAVQVSNKIEEHFNLQLEENKTVTTTEKIQAIDEKSIATNNQKIGNVPEVKTEKKNSIVIGNEEDLTLYLEFVAESSFNIVTLEEGLLSLESEPDDEDLINTIFRSFHSLKGAAGFLGLTSINLICHESETLLDKLRKKTIKADQRMIDEFLKVVDMLKMLNEHLGDSLSRIKQDLPNAILYFPSFDCDSLVNSIKRLESYDNIDDYTFLLSDCSQNQAIDEANFQAGEDDLSNNMQESVAAPRLKKRASEISSLKIETERLDSLLDLVGELVISQSIVSQDKVLSIEINGPLQKSIVNLGKVTKNIQDQVMSLRMLSLKQTFQKMTRLVRDLSKKMNKKITFHTSGEETELDKTLIEELNDPLVHLMRNSLDHGIETPEERAKLGKTEAGNIYLRAYYKSGNVYIEIEDDGQGIDRELILSKAVEQGVVSAVSEQSDYDLLNLIFEPGLSTVKCATDVSGRGVGMDVVRSNIEKLGGKIEIISNANEGVKFIIRLPLTMAIVDGMVV